MKNKKMIVILLIVFVVVVVVGILLTQNLNKTQTQKSYDQAVGYIKQYMKSIDVSNATPVKSTVALGGTTSLAEELPNIDQYPLTVTGNGDINIEIFSSPEKSGDDTDGWLNEVAKEFNKSGQTIDGQTISVSVRSIASGASVDYLVSGKYIPDAYSPSNEIWVEMIKAQNVELTQIDKCLVENTAGILISQSTSDALKQKYGKVDLQTIVQATVNNEIAMGYTNPYASSTGINFLISTLANFDEQNPLSSTAVSGFQKFQENVPFVSYTTMQMRSAAESGSLDAFILEYQTYINDSTLMRDYTFIPFGVEHNNPMYAVGNLDEKKSEALKLFTNYCKNTSAQNLAKQYGFNQNVDYTSNVKLYDGKTLLQAQDLWKKEKDVSKPIIAVFVTDVSGSMSGTPLTNLKKSLNNSMQYINSNNYIGLISYSTDVTINLPIDQFNINQKSYFSGAIDSLSANGNTSTFDAIIVAANMLIEKQKEVPDSKLMMFVLSDGETNNGHSITQATNVIKNLNIPIYTIGYNANISELQKISSINEAASIDADSEDVIYQLKNLFNSNL